MGAFPLLYFAIYSNCSALRMYTFTIRKSRVENTLRKLASGFRETLLITHSYGAGLKRWEWYSINRKSWAPHLDRFKCFSRGLCCLLPDPVRPTMPIFSLGLMVKDTFFRTRGRFSWYLISAFSKVTSPSWGQSGEGALFLILAGASKDRVWGDRVAGSDWPDSVGAARLSKRM